MFTRERRSQIMANIRSVDTAPEVALRSLVHQLGYRFRLHRSDLPGKPDLVLPGRHAVIMMHGCFWHGHTCKDGRRPRSNGAYWNDKLDKNRRRDRRNLSALRRLGWKCMIVWECALNKPEWLRKRIHRFLGDQA
ncbi:MAG: DNA mismatch endonuclease Vsr [Bryobacteraceae bacterium]|nr:DNA mismatch endonuclease Vsr [Bryobacteraceae bacterium]